jgi:hypothetical protein
MTDKIEEQGHKRGCEGRNYACTCGYDDRVEAEFSRLRSSNEALERERAEEWRRRREAEASRDVEKAVTDTLKRENEAMRKALEPFCLAFERRRDAYSKRYKDRDLGYANFDKMPDDWAIEKVAFNMGDYSRACSALSLQEEEAR